MRSAPGKGGSARLRGRVAFLESKVHGLEETVALLRTALRRGATPFDVTAEAPRLRRDHSLRSDWMTADGDSSLRTPAGGPPGRPGVGPLT